MRFDLIMNWINDGGSRPRRAPAGETGHPRPRPTTHGHPARHRRARQAGRVLTALSLLLYLGAPAGSAELAGVWESRYGELSSPRAAAPVQPSTPDLPDLQESLPVEFPGTLPFDIRDLPELGVRTPSTFRLCAEPCTSSRHRIRPSAPGTLKIEARWTGSAEDLSLALRGPGSETYAQSSGQSPLSLQVRLTESMLEKEGPWWVVVKEPGDGEARGELSITLPGAEEARTEASRGQGEATRAERNGLRVIERRVNEEGLPEVVYADGSRKVRHSDGRTFLHTPDGRSREIFEPMMNIGPLEPPSGLSREQLEKWLGKVAGRVDQALGLVITPEERERLLGKIENEDYYERLLWRLDFLEFYLSEARD